MTRELLEKYVKEHKLSGVYAINELVIKPKIKGYAKDEHSWFYYEVDEQKKIYKKYFKTEQECINTLFSELK